VEPDRLVLLGRRWYLVAYDPSRDDWRSFRLDRMLDPRPTRARFHRRELPADDAAAFVREGIERSGATHRVEAIVDAPADLVRDRVGRWASVEPLDDHQCRVHMATDSLDWPAFAFGTLGADFTVLSPPELLDQLRDWSRRFGQAATG
jgi:predicted DNA-binding transcriptional regulator YafY